jgi:hypothetical protein
MGGIMTHELLSDFHNWLLKELPAHEGDLVQRLGVLHRMMPNSFAGWPRTPEQVTAAMQSLAAEQLVELVGFQWRVVVQVKREERLLWC